MKLHYRTIGEGEPLFILHGLFGSSDNWQTLGKRFAEYHKVYFVDQRNHGRSPHSNEFDYQCMAADFYELVQEVGETNINIIGHSMGGKTTIEFAKNHPELINKMVIADICQKQYPLHHDQILEGLNAIDLAVTHSRKEVETQLAKLVEGPGVRQFLLKNLYWIEPGKLAWRINVPVLTEKINEVLAEIKFDTIRTNTLFVRGGLSNYILESDFAEIEHKFPFSEIVTLENSGHWVHAEAPDEFFNTVQQFLLH